MWKAAKERGDSEVCFTTEFGPPNYQVTNSVHFHDNYIRNYVLGLRS